MTALWKTATWNQFGAAIEMLADAVRACPDELWRFRLWPPPPEGRGFFRFPEFSEFWYLAYTLDAYCAGWRLDKKGRFRAQSMTKPFCQEELGPWNWTWKPS